jgi:hypothetical protein
VDDFSESICQCGGWSAPLQSCLEEGGSLGLMLHSDASSHGTCLISVHLTHPHQHRHHVHTLPQLPNSPSLPSLLPPDHLKSKSSPPPSDPSQDHTLRQAMHVSTQPSLYDAPAALVSGIAVGLKVTCSPRGGITYDTWSDRVWLRLIAKIIEIWGCKRRSSA